MSLKSITRDKLGNRRDREEGQDMLSLQHLVAAPSRNLKGKVGGR